MPEPVKFNHSNFLSRAPLGWFLSPQGKNENSLEIYGLFHALMSVTVETVVVCEWQMCASGSGH